MPPKKPAASIPVERLRHNDMRSNIPTQEMRDFAAADENRPKSVTFPGLLYARDPSLDPQLVWKGKDELDREPLTVPAVPVYIQEHVQPKAIIDEIRAQAKADAPERQMELLFNDFNGLDFQKRIEFYQHEQHWANRMVLGDSLLVMTSLLEKEGLRGKVQTIYMDPPYGIKFGSNWQVSTRKRDVKDGAKEDLAREPEVVKAFRDTWVRGVNSYLTYLRDRLVVARELLADSGSLFVQIGDENVHLVRSLMDEVFGSANYIALINFLKTSGQTAKYLSVTNDHLIWYGKDSEQTKYRHLFLEKALGGDGAAMYQFVELADWQRRRLTSDESSSPALLPDGARPYRLGDVTSQRQGRPSGPGSAMYFPVEVAGEAYYPAGSRGWSTTEEGMRRLAVAGRLSPQGQRVSYVRYLSDFQAYELDNNWGDTAGAPDRAYVVETNPTVVARCILMTTDPGDLVLDPTCGGGTTAYVAEQWGRRWITIDTSRVALALARIRLMAARYPYYLLSDSPEGVKKETEITGLVPPPYQTTGDVKKGFVHKRVPHVTLKAIANNAEIDTIHAKHQEHLEPLRARLNGLLKQKWEEWQVPRDADAAWSGDAKKVHEEWWKLRRERQKEIDASIARHADTELLYDQPYEDNKRVRVSGPFTVESLSPHRVLSVDEERPESERSAQRDGSAGSFEAMILENLRKAGVQNTRKDERLKFDRLDPFAGTWLQAAGEFTDKSGTARRVVVSIGPEYGAVGSEQVKEAAKEALKGAGFDLLVVCGLAFDAYAGETAKEFQPDAAKKQDGFAVAEDTKQFGKLPVMLARINPDLTMGDELLKNTGAGNLFMVFGEPDIEITTGGDGRLTLEVRGVDVYDPTTRQVRNSSTDDIACWFIDTDYNGDCFFVRHAYFCGGDEPYDRLKRALRAEIDEAAWASLYSTRSRPFPRPKTGKIAVKVINHYGDEVMKVYAV